MDSYTNRTYHMDHELLEESLGSYASQNVQPSHLYEA